MKKIKPKNNLASQKNIKKGNTGITLIALVVTIIVLLILAGISIAMLSGDNSILQRATDAKETMERADAKEQAQLDILAWQSNKISKGENSELDDDVIKGILTGKSYVKNETPGENSFETKNGHEILYSELYTSNKPVNKIGKYVHYDVNIGLGNTSSVDDDWRVFYEENGLTYLIATDSIPKEKVPTGTSGEHYTGLLEGADNSYSVGWDVPPQNYLTKTEILPEIVSKYKLNWKTNKTIADNEWGGIAVAQLLDPDAWEDFVIAGGKEQGIEAVGAPTLELWKASYERQENIPLYIKYDSQMGYGVSWSEPVSDSDYSVYFGWENRNGNDLYFPVSQQEYWLASSAAYTNGALFYVDSRYIMATACFGRKGIRPVIAIPTNLIGKMGSNSEIRYVE